MKSRRIIKKLMAAGIQRNDAATFIKTYRAIKAAGMGELFSEMNTPIPAPPEIYQRTIKPVQLKTTNSINKLELERASAIDLRLYIKDRLTKELIRGIQDSGAIKFTMREMPYSVDFSAEIMILPPVYEEGHDKPFGLEGTRGPEV